MPFTTIESIRSGFLSLSVGQCVGSLDEMQVSLSLFNALSSCRQFGDIVRQPQYVCLALQSPRATNRLPKVLKNLSQSPSSFYFMLRRTVYSRDSEGSSPVFDHQIFLPVFHLYNNIPFRGVLYYFLLTQRYLHGAYLSGCDVWFNLQALILK